MTHLTDDELTAHYYGELGDEADAIATAHIDQCDQCHQSLARLKRVMAAIDMVTMPEPPADFEAKVWQRLQPAMANDADRFGVSSRTSLWKLGGWGTMAAGLMFAAFLAGRMWPVDPAAGNRQTSTAQPGSTSDGATAPGDAASSDTTAIGERVLLVNLEDHLDRTEQTLVEFVGRLDASGNAGARSRTEDLVADNRLYRGSAESSGDQAVTDVLDDLERVLIEIAGVSANASPAELDAIRKRIDTRDLLFKVRVMRMELEQRASDPRPAKRQGPTT